MLFIIMATAIGLFASAAARTVNQNHIDRAMYAIGADLVIQENWPFIDPEPELCSETGLLLRRPNQYLLFTEPPFEIWNETEGVALATKVYRNGRASVRVPVGAGTILGAGRAGTARDVNVMAIYPDEFARVAWWRSDMFDYHFYHKMNAMSVNPNVALLSRNLMNRLNIAHGGEIRVTWPNHRNEVVLYVYDAVDFFPAFHSVDSDGAAAYLIVMNYELVKTEFRLEPYEIWIRKENGTTAADVLRSHIDNGVSIQHVIGATGPPAVRMSDIDNEVSMLHVRDAQANLTAVRNDPLILSMNGLLTLSFLMILAVTVISFLVFWIFELQSRWLQISIMRSMGMSKGSVTAMLLWEHALLSLLPLIAGFVLGEVGSSLFVPMFEIGGAEAELPFRVFRQRADSLRVGAVVSVSIVLAIAMLRCMAARINISQTLKLGEE